jgi:hypothetical protein
MYVYDLNFYLYIKKQYIKRETLRNLLIINITPPRVCLSQVKTQIYIGLCRLLYLDF